MSLFLGQATADFVQRTALHQSHDKEDEFLVVPHLVYHDDVVMLQLRRDARFLQKPLGHSRREVEARLHDLDGHASSEAQVGSDVHNGHAATTYLAGNVVETDRRGTQAIKQRIVSVLTIGKEVCHDGASGMCVTVLSSEFARKVLRQL